jgi:hypothetical protein
MNPDKAPKTSESTRNRGKSAGPAFRRVTCKGPPANMSGKPRRLKKRFGIGWHEVIAWAQSCAWWPLCINERGEPYSDQRFWIFILREEPQP